MRTTLDCRMQITDCRGQSQTAQDFAVSTDLATTLGSSSVAHGATTNDKAAHEPQGRRAPNLPTLLLAVVLPLALVSGASLQVHGQASAWLLGGRDTSFQVQVGLRYIPDVTLKAAVSRSWNADAELSADYFGLVEVRGTGVELRPNRYPTLYRLWTRLSSERFEARLGLQRINFGSATLLRPLMWFDRIDPRDPLQITDGVYALLLRYYFQDNANVWAWGLLGNSSRKDGRRILRLSGLRNWADASSCRFPGARSRPAITTGRRAFLLIPRTRLNSHPRIA